MQGKDTTRAHEIGTAEEERSNELRGIGIYKLLVTKESCRLGGSIPLLACG